MQKLNKLIQRQSMVYLTKNHDYGNSFAESIAKHGEVAYIVRAEDKVRRIKTLMTKEVKVVDESIKDTIIDLLNYTCMLVAYDEEMQDVVFYKFVHALNTYLTHPTSFMEMLVLMLDDVITDEIHDYIVAFLIAETREEAPDDIS